MRADSECKLEMRVIGYSFQHYYTDVLRLVGTYEVTDYFSFSIGGERGEGGENT